MFLDYNSTHIPQNRTDVRTWGITLIVFVEQAMKLGGMTEDNFWLRTEEGYLFFG